MKITFIAIFVLCLATANAQDTSLWIDIRNKIDFDKAQLYIFCRGTKRKSSMIAKEFNTKDTNISHVGIAFAEQNNIDIYHVTDNNNSSSALVKDSIQSFFNLSEVYYLSVWKYKASIKAISKVKAFCENLARRKIYFDSNFKLEDSDTLYCSEFCALALNSIVEDHPFMPIEKKLTTPFCIQFLGRPTLTYYPVDFFQKNRNFVKIYERWVK